MARAVEGTSAAAARGRAITEINGNAVGESLQSYCDAIGGAPSGRPVSATVVDRSTGDTEAVRLRLE